MLFLAVKEEEMKLAGRETLSITDRAYIINEGEIISSGSPHQVAHDDKVKQIYLGEKFSF